MSPSPLSWTIAGNVETRCRAALTCRNCSRTEEEEAVVGNWEVEVQTGKVEDTLAGKVMDTWV